MELKIILLKKIYQLKRRFRRTSPIQLSSDSRSLPKTVTNFSETYHLMIRIYQNGKLEEVIRALPEFANQGIRQLWISPLHSQSKYKLNDHGYWPENHQDIDPLLGDEEDLRKLIHIASGLNIQILLDAPINHVGYHAKFKLAGKSISLEDPVFFRKQKPSEKKDQLLWELLNSVEFEHDFKEIQKKIHQRPLYGLPTFVHENKIIQDYLIESYKLFIDLGISSFRIDAANIIPVDFQVRFMNELTEYAEKSGKSLIFFLDLWLWDKPLELFLNQVLPRLNKKNIFIDDTHLTSMMRVAVFHEFSFKMVKEILRNRKVKKNFQDLLVAFPESHDYQLALKEEFDKLALYAVGEFCSKNPLIIHHGKEDVVTGKNSNRDPISKLNFNSQFFKTFSSIRQAISPYKEKDFSCDVEEGLPDEVLVLRQGNNELILIVNIGDEFIYEADNQKKITKIAGHGSIEISEGKITLGKKSIIMAKLE